MNTIPREKYVCTGDLLPEDHSLGLAPLTYPQGNWNLTVGIEHSMVRVELDVPKAHNQLDTRVHSYSLLRGAQDIADWWLSVISFFDGGRYSTRISRIEDASGCIRDFGPRIEFGLDGEDLRVERTNAIAGAVTKLAHTNRHFELALRDYAAGLRWSQDAAFHCYRALEALRWHYGGKWAAMHKSLGTNHCAIYTLIQQHADKIRHGEPLEEEDYRELDRSAYYALKYVRDTLKAFMIENIPLACCMEKPVLDHSSIPDHISAKHKGNCPLSVRDARS